MLRRKAVGGEVSQRRTGDRIGRLYAERGRAHIAAAACVALERECGRGRAARPARSLRARSRADRESLRDNKGHVYLDAAQLMESLVLKLYDIEVSEGGVDASRPLFVPR